LMVNCLKHSERYAEAIYKFYITDIEVHLNKIKKYLQ